MNNFYVYTLLDTRKKFDSNINGVRLSFLPFYIGKGVGRRCNVHLCKSHYNSSQSHKNRVIKRVLSEGLEVKIVKLFTGLTEQQALDIEVNIIRQLGKINTGGILTNVTDGGDGIRGFSFKSESKLKISKSLKLYYAKTGGLSEKRVIEIASFNKQKILDGTHHFITDNPSKYPEIKKKISDSNKLAHKEGRSVWTKPNHLELRKRAGIRLTEFNKINKLGNTNTAKAYVINNGKSEFKIRNLAKFCKDNNLIVQKFRKLFNKLKVDTITNQGLTITRL